MLTCVILIATSAKGASKKTTSVNMKSSSGYALAAFGMALLAPLLISLFIAVSRYWTEHYGYTGLDFTMDTYMVMGLVEVPFFIHHALGQGYTVKVLLCGIGASMGQIFGTMLMIYAATYGLAGPSSAMVQVQGIFHITLSALFFHVIPNNMQIIGILCSVAGATIMSVDIPCLSDKEDFIKVEDEDEDENTIIL